MKRILFSILFFVPTIAFSQVKTAEIDENMGIFFDVMRQLDYYYVDTLDYKDIVETAITQMLRKTDPYTVYFPSSKDADLRMMTTGKYGGIGAIIAQREIQVNDSTTERWVFISDPYEGMPAQIADLWAGDKILSVNGIDMKNKSVKEVSDQLRGASETKIKVVVERYGVEEPIEKEFLRKEIKLPPIPYYDAFDGIGYIALTEFTEHSSQQFKRALDELKEQKNINGLIIDLRNNGGGIIDEAIRIVSNFVPRGTMVVETKGKIESSHRIYKTTQTPGYLDFPVVVLMNKNSASASEIVAGSLQDLGRATVVGEQSYGKGLVQSVRSLQHEGGHLKVTTAHYYLPSGRCIQKINYAHRELSNNEGGIKPDIEIKDTNKVDISYDLFAKNLIFDYATRFHANYLTIPPAEQFTLMEDDLEDFCQFLEDTNYVYRTETSKNFEKLLSIARQEDMDTATYNMLVRIKDEINPPFRKSIEEHKEKVINVLTAEIIKRYYYQRGVAAYQIRHDKIFAKTLEEAKKLVQQKQTSNKSKKRK